MKKSLVDKLNQHTIELGLPHYNSFQEAYSLAEDLYRQMPVEKILELSDDEINNLFLIPNKCLKNPITDANLYSALSVLNMALFSVSESYKKHGIERQEYLDDNLASIMPRQVSVLDLVNMGSNSDLEEFCRGFPLYFLESIEDKMYLLKDYNPRKTTPHIDKFMKKQIKEIPTYANLGLRASKIINGFGLPLEAGSMQGVLNEFTDKKVLWESLQRDDLYYHFGNLLKLHAHMSGLILHDGFNYDFRGLFGHEITETMHLANAIQMSTTMLSNVESSDHKQVIVPFKGETYFFQKLPTIDDSADDSAYALGHFAEEILNLRKHIFFSDSFFNGLSSRLTALGIPSEKSKKLSDYLVFNFVERNIPTKRSSRMHKKDAYKEVLSKEREENYPQALSRLVTLLTGKNPAQVSYHFFSEEEGFKHASGISTISNITKLNYKLKEKIEVIEERDSKLTSEQEIEIAKQKFKQEDVYIGPNNGACFTLDIDPISNIFNPVVSEIDVRDAQKHILDYDEIAYKIANLQVDVHEMIHASQIGSRLIWRNFASGVGKFYLDQAIKQYKKGLLDTECPTNFMGRMLSPKKRKTWREEFTEGLDFYALLGLSIDPLAKKMRKYGGILGMLKDNVCPVDEEGRINVTELRELLFPFMEDSMATRLYLETKQSLENGDLSHLEKTEEKLQTYSTDLGGILETMTESFSLIGCRDIIEKGFKGLNRKEKDYYKQSLEDKLTTRGIQAKKFIDIAENLPKNRWNQELSKLGLKYMRVFDQEENIQVHSMLNKLGFNPLNPADAYKDMEQLERLTTSLGIPLNKVLTKINSANALIGLRYSSRIPIILKYIEKHGTKQAFKKLLDLESWNDIEKDL